MARGIGLDLADKHVGQSRVRTFCKAMRRGRSRAGFRRDPHDAGVSDRLIAGNALSQISIGFDGLQTRIEEIDKRLGTLMPCEIMSGKLIGPRTSLGTSSKGLRPILERGDPRSPLMLHAKPLSPLTQSSVHRFMRLWLRARAIRSTVRPSDA